METTESYAHLKESRSFGISCNLCRSETSKRSVFDFSVNLHFTSVLGGFYIHDLNLGISKSGRLKAQSDADEEDEMPDFIHFNKNSELLLHAFTISSNGLSFFLTPGHMTIMTLL